jgi:hypothetical protein
MLINDRRRAYEKLCTALEEMQEASTLRQIGESAAIINHEIRNYLTRILGSAELLQLTETISTDGKKEIESIKKTVGDMQHFSMDILQLSRARIVREKEMLAVVPLIRQCIARHFPDYRERIRLDCDDEMMTIRCEWDKMEHVFVNIIKNSFEAAASMVAIKTISTGSIHLISIIDDGIGCSADQIATIFKAFFTTKKAGQGTGLGMSFCRAVVESHGGHISAYSFNELGVGRHGVQIAISLPQFCQSGKSTDNRYGRIALVRDGLGEFGSLLGVFNNVNMYPAIFQRFEELDRKKDGDIQTLIVAENLLKQGLGDRAITPSLIIPVFSKNGITYAKKSLNGSGIEIFSEEFILSRLFKPV